MRRGVFKPYTKERAVRILRGYFKLTAADAEREAERLGACVVRDGLSANKHLCAWESKMRVGKVGNINELLILYPANQRILGGK